MVRPPGRAARPSRQAPRSAEDRGEDAARHPVRRSRCLDGVQPSGQAGGVSEGRRTGLSSARGSHERRRGDAVPERHRALLQSQVRGTDSQAPDEAARNGISVGRRRTGADRFAAFLAEAQTASAKGEFTLRGRDGNLIPVHVSLNRFLPYHGQALGMVVTDLSEQKRKQVADMELARRRTGSSWNAHSRRRRRNGGGSPANCTTSPGSC